MDDDTTVWFVSSGVVNRYSVCVSCLDKYIHHYVQAVLMVICISLGNDVPIRVFANLPCQYV